MNDVERQHASNTIRNYINALERYENADAAYQAFELSPSPSGHEKMKDEALYFEANERLEDYYEERHNLEHLLKTMSETMSEDSILKNLLITVRMDLQNHDLIVVRLLLKQTCWMSETIEHTTTMTIESFEFWLLRWFDLFAQTQWMRWMLSSEPIYFHRRVVCRFRVGSAFRQIDPHRPEILYGEGYDPLQAVIAALLTQIHPNTLIRESLFNRSRNVDVLEDPVFSTQVY